MNIKKRIIYLTLLLSLAFTISACSKVDNTITTSSPKVELTISAAASLKDVMSKLEENFKVQHPNYTLTFNFGSSGSLMEQIKQGAPSDVFISAGASQMKELDAAGLIQEDTNKSLVQNALVLVGPKDTSLTSFSDLTTDKVTHIGVGEPSSVPAGKYADETLTKLGIKYKVTSKLVFAKDVKEVLAWSASGNTEAGFAYLSDAKGNDTVKIIETIPEDMHSPIIYPIGVIKASKNLEGAKIFEDYLFTDDAQKIFEDYGYSLVK